MISPSIVSALAQSLQVPDVSGMENNTILFEYGVHDGEDVVAEVTAGLRFAAATSMNRLLLQHREHFFGVRQTIHL